MTAWLSLKAIALEPCGPYEKTTKDYVGKERREMRGGVRKRGVQLFQPRLFESF